MWPSKPTLIITVEVSKEAYDAIDTNPGILEEVKIQTEQACSKNSKIGEAKVTQVDISLLSLTRSYKPEK